MSSPLLLQIILIAAMIVVVIVCAALLPRWIRRSTGSAGERAGARVAASRRMSILDELGTTVVLHAPAPVAREIVDGAVLQQPRKFTPLGDGGYGIRFVEPDDAIARLVSDPDGTRLQVESSREHLGMPQNADFWRELRSHVASAAAARGIPVTEGARREYVRGEGQPPVWTVVGGEERS